MRLILGFLVLCSGTALSQYIQEKTRFDRSVHDDSGVLITDEYLPLKEWTFYDYDTNFKAYRDKEENICYLEKMDDSVAIEDLPGYGTQKKISKILYASTNVLTKLEAWRIVGGRIIEFCHGRDLILLQNTVPVIEQMPDPLFNIIPQDENDILTRRIADVVLIPLQSRSKRQVILEEQEKLNEDSNRARMQRQAQQLRGKFRGQTQSQYLNMGNEEQKEGKAEAEATQQSSRAIVSGSRGMGQAQSMSFGSSGCEDCLKYSSEGAPDRYVHLPSTGPINQHGVITPGTDTDTTFPRDRGGTFYPVGTPGTVTDKITYPSGVPGTTTTGGGFTYPGGTPGATIGGGVVYPGGVPGTTTGGTPGTTTGAGVVYPGGVPGTTTGGGVTYPGGTPGTTTGAGAVYPGGVPGTRIGGGVTYPGGTPGTTTGAGVVYPGGVPGTTTGGGVTYPGSVPGTTTGGGAVYPGGVPRTTTTGGGVSYPGSTPGTTIGGGVVYPGGVPGTTTTGGGVTYPGGTPGTTTGAGVVYPGGVPGTTTGGGVTYPGSIPGTTAGGGVVYPGGVPGTTTGGGVVYPGSVPGTTTGGDIVYPGGTAGTIPTGGGVTYHGGVPGTTTGGGAVYPGGVPGTTTRGGVVYPGGVPGSTTGGGVVYPAGPPGTIPTGGGVTYPGGVLGTTTGGGVVYPGGVSGTTTGGGVVYPGGVPGSTTGGGVVYPAGPPSTIPTSGGVTYPGGVPGTTTTGGGVTYPGGAPSTTTAGGGIVYPASIPGTTTTGGGVIYPGSAPGITTTGVGVTYPRGIPGTTTGGSVYPGGLPGTTATGSGVVYPGGVPGTAVIYPASIPGTTYPAGVPGTATTGGIRQIYPGVVPGVGYPSGVPGVNYPGSTPGTAGGSGVIYPGDRTGSSGQIVTEAKATTDTKIYPGQIPSYPGGGSIITSGTPGVIPTNMGIYPGSSQTGTPESIPHQLHYPGGTAPGGTNVIHTGPDGKMIYYPESTQFKPGPGVYQPGIQIGPDGRVINYPSTSGTISSPYPIQQGQYPSGTTWQGVQGQTTPDMTGGISRPEEYMSRGQKIGQQYPTEMKPTGEAAQYYQQAGSIPSAEDNNSNSQASSSIKQTDSGTQASASSQGIYGQGTAQSQVTGTYSGSGSFSAQAGSSDTNKSVQTEISGGKDGATSNAQGSGGYGKSQAQVQLDSESGATSTGAQSSGWNHGTNSQVQASSRGGMADAQANGEGSTSSQAQIGFQPYLKTDEKLERHSRPFHGGGTASAQSGMYRGQSQSQLEGSFQYGITYSGAAQAGSGSGAAASKKPFKFNLTDTELFKSFKPYNTPQITRSNESSIASKSPDNDYNQDKPTQGLQPSSSSRRTVFANATRETSQSVDNKQNQSGEKLHTDDTMYDYDEEYDGDDYDASQVQTSNAKYSKNYVVEQNNSDYQSQMIHVATGNQYDVHVHQDSTAAQPGDMLQPGQSLSGYTIPPGFRGRVKSVAGDETIAHGDGKSQSQTVSLTPLKTGINHENKSPSSEIRSLKTNHERLAENHILTKEKHQKQNSFSHQHQQTSTDRSKPANVPIKPSYYTVTNSFAGKMDSKNSPKKYEHRYYTKSSTCGYFTFSCNIVYGSNGRTKICKPKIPTYPDGTPMKC